MNQFSKVIRGNQLVLQKSTYNSYDKEQISFDESPQQLINLGTEQNIQTIITSNRWDLMLTKAATKIFLQYRNVFTWAYKNSKQSVEKIANGGRKRD